MLLCVKRVMSGCAQSISECVLQKKQTIYSSEHVRGLLGQPLREFLLCLDPKLVIK